MKNKKDAIVSDIKWKISSGIYSAPNKLPSENALSIKYNCSRMTARASLQELINEGLLVSRKGKGYFVSMGQHKLVYKPLKGKKGEIEKFHIVDVPFSALQCKVFRTIDPSVRTNKKNFNFSFIKTQFDSKKVPYTVLHSYLNTHLTGNFKIATLKKSLSAFFNSKDIRIKNRTQKTVVEIPPLEVTLKLNLPKNEKVVTTYSVMYDHDDEPIEIAIRYTILEQYNEVVEKNY